jgi:hypothetical protein
MSVAGARVGGGWDGGCELRPLVRNVSGTGIEVARFVFMSVAEVMNSCGSCFLVSLLDNNQSLSKGHT